MKPPEEWVVMGEPTEEKMVMWAVDSESDGESKRLAEKCKMVTDGQ
jgi:hypothetical protein